MMRCAAPGPSRRRAAAEPEDALTGRWLVDARRSTLRVAVKLGRLKTVSGTFADVCGVVEIGNEPAASRVQASVGTASLSSGNSCVDSLMHGAGIIDSTRNPTVDFVSSALRIDPTAGSWLLDGLLATDSALLDVTLAMPDPVTSDGQLICRATGVLPSREAVRLLSQPGVERVLGPTMQLDLTLVATRG